MKRLMCCFLLFAPSTLPAQNLGRLPYNHLGLVVDLGVGLWAWPVPCDVDGDGDFDLLVSCPDKPSNGVWYFENAAGDTSKNKMPVFKPGKLPGKADAFCHSQICRPLACKTTKKLNCKRKQASGIESRTAEEGRHEGNPHVGRKRKPFRQGAGAQRAIACRYAPTRGLNILRNAKQRGRSMGEVMSMAEIKAKFKDEWIVLDDPEILNDVEPISGVLIYHGTSRKEAWAEANRLASHSCAVFFNGPPLAEGVGAVL